MTLYVVRSAPVPAEPPATQQGAVHGAPLGERNHATNTNTQQGAAAVAAAAESQSNDSKESR
jgi:hypothetical protein